MRLRAFARTLSIAASILLLFFACQRDDEATNYLAGEQASFLQNFTRHTPDKGFKDYVIASLIKHDSVTPFFNNFYAQYGQPLWDVGSISVNITDSLSQWVVPVINPNRDKLTAIMLFTLTTKGMRWQITSESYEEGGEIAGGRRLMFDFYRQKLGLPTANKYLLIPVKDFYDSNYAVIANDFIVVEETTCTIKYTCDCESGYSKDKMGWQKECYTRETYYYFNSENQLPDYTDGPNGGWGGGGGSGIWTPPLNGGGSTGGGYDNGGDNGDGFPFFGGGVVVLLLDEHTPKLIQQTMDAEKEFNDMMFYYRSRAKNDNFEWLCSKIVGQQQIVSAKGKPEGLSVGFHEGDLEWVIHTHYPGTVGMYSAGDLIAIVNLAAAERITYNFWLGLVNAKEERYALAVSDPLAFTAFCAKYKDNPNQLKKDYEKNKEYYNARWTDEQIKAGFIKFLNERNTGLSLFEDKGEPFKPKWEFQF